MRFLALSCALLLASCGGVQTAINSAATVADAAGAPAPVTIDDKTTLDETALLRLERLYKAARTAVEMAVDAGVIRGALATRIAAADTFAFSKLRLARAAYDTGNAASYAQALREAEPAIAAIWGK